jgi:hypothetical protein
MEHEDLSLRFPPMPLPLNSVFAKNIERKDQIRCTVDMIQPRCCRALDQTSRQLQTTLKVYYNV